VSKKLVSLKIDVIFKKFFIENKDLLRVFLADVLEIPIDEIEEIIVTNPEMTPEDIDGKFSRLDLNLKLRTRQINLEIQIKFESDYSDRSLFYWAKLYTSDLKKGCPYGSLKQAISVNIINFNMFEGNNYHTEVAAMIKGTNEIFSDKFSIHFFELKKVVGKIDLNDRKELWMRLIKADSEEEFQMLAKTKEPVIEKAVKVIFDMSEDTRIREMARQREKRLHDEASLMQGAKNEGIAIGEARGIKIGEARGIKIGEAQGKEQAKLKAILDLMETLSFTEKQAMEALKISEDEQEIYLSKLENI